MSIPNQFYDELADDYHLNYQDWHAAVPRQGRVLAHLIRNVRGHAAARTLPDCTSGIGTQALGLALQGFTVTGTDISPRSIDRARREAEGFEVSVVWSVADVRRLSEEVPGTFDVVIACDNSLPHLLTDDDLALALENMHAKVVPGGLVMIGVRDYDRLRSERPRFTPPQIVERDGMRSVLLQLWDWAEDGTTYRLTMFRHRQADGQWTSRTGSTIYRALTRAQLEGFMERAGFVDIMWDEPEATGHHQPLVTARRPGQE
ncbi:MAG: class I SAM-dependent methyltransferase [Chloroflexi bacterium]|nr:class I SAM-dependent methyltransferase [Chloroflexota bacterium]